METLARWWVDLGDPFGALGAYRVDSQHGHVETEGTLGDVATQAPHADDGENAAFQFNDGRLFPLTFPLKDSRSPDPPGKGQQQSPGVL